MEATFNCHSTYWNSWNFGDSDSREEDGGWSPVQGWPVAEALLHHILSSRGTSTSESQFWWFSCKCWEWEGMMEMGPCQCKWVRMLWAFVLWCLHLLDHRSFHRSQKPPFPHLQQDQKLWHCLGLQMEFEPGHCFGHWNLSGSERHWVLAEAFNVLA